MVRQLNSKIAKTCTLYSFELPTEIKDHSTFMREERLEFPFITFSKVSFTDIEWIKTRYKYILDNEESWFWVDDYEFGNTLINKTGIELLIKELQKLINK